MRAVAALVVSLTLCGVAVAANGTEGDDRLTGTRGADVFNGREGDDIIEGRRGKDRLVGGRGYDVLSGGAGKDHIDARRGDEDRINCGPGVDVAIVDVTEDGVFDCETVHYPG